MIPVYNTGKWLSSCLDSVTAQTFRDLEILCVDDGSTDGSAQILERCAATDERIRILRIAHSGQSAARNSALDAATGEFVLFVDSDDSIPLDAVEKMVAAAEESGLDIVASSAFWKGENLPCRKRTVRWRVEAPALKRFVHNRKIHSSVCNKLYRMSVIGETRFISGICHEDWPFNLEIFIKVRKFVLVDEPMYIIRQRPGSITRSPFSRLKAEGYLAAIRLILGKFGNVADFKYIAYRVAVAMKMLVSKTYKSRDAALERFVIEEIMSLKTGGILSSVPLDMKTRLRIFIMKRRRRFVRYE